MKRFLFFGTLLSILILSLASSCKKEDDDDTNIVPVTPITPEDEIFEVPYIITNNTTGIVSLYANGNVITFIKKGEVKTGSYTAKNVDFVVFVAKDNSDTEVMKIMVEKGGSLMHVIEPAANNSQETNEWSMAYEITNKASFPVHYYFDGKDIGIVQPNVRWSGSYDAGDKQSVLVEVKTVNGRLLDSKKILKEGYYQTTIKNPTFTINKIILTDWYAGNLFDRPDPWFNISVANSSVGRTDYMPDRNDGDRCTFSDLNIVIENVFSRVDFDLYDYNLGYSSTGSSFISGLYTESFSDYWGESIFVMSTSKLTFTVYGVWK